MMTKDSQFGVISFFSKSNEINFNSFEYKFCVLIIFDQSPTSSFLFSFKFLKFLIPSKVPVSRFHGLLMVPTDKWFLQIVSHSSRPSIRRTLLPVLHPELPLSWAPSRNNTAQTLRLFCNHFLPRYKYLPTSLVQLLQMWPFSWNQDCQS